MERLFYKKTNAILIVAAIVVLILLLCLLLSFLTQLSGMKSTIDEINALLERAEQDEQAKQQLINYKKTDGYVIDWAVSMGYIPDNVYNYITGE